MWRQIKKSLVACPLILTLIILGAAIIEERPNPRLERLIQDWEGGEFEMFMAQGNNFMYDYTLTPTPTPTPSQSTITVTETQTVPVTTSLISISITTSTQTSYVTETQTVETAGPTVTVNVSGQSVTTTTTTTIGPSTVTVTPDPVTITVTPPAPLITCTNEPVQLTCPPLPCPLLPTDCKCPEGYHCSLTEPDDPCQDCPQQVCIQDCIQCPTFVPECNCNCNELCVIIPGTCLSCPKTICLGGKRECHKRFFNFKHQTDVLIVRPMCLNVLVQIRMTASISRRLAPLVHRILVVQRSKQPTFQRMK